MFVPLLFMNMVKKFFTQGKLLLMDLFYTCVIAEIFQCNTFSLYLLSINNTVSSFLCRQGIFLFRSRVSL